MPLYVTIEVRTRTRRAGKRMTDASIEFRLYVAGEAPNSQQAVVNLNAFCRRYLADRHHIEIVDVLQQPQRALDEGILLTPALIIRSPGPARTLIGNLARPEVLRQALNLPDPNT